jgi:hypothetical protein
MLHVGVMQHFPQQHVPVLHCRPGLWKNIDHTNASDGTDFAPGNVHETEVNFSQDVQYEFGSTEQIFDMTFSLSFAKTVSKGCCMLGSCIYPFVCFLSGVG